MKKHLMPSAPKITAQEFQKYRESGDFSPIFFEWYKSVGELCIFFSQIQYDSAGLTSISNLHYAVLIGLLNRCSKLMLANIALSHEGLFGETTAIVDRCIFEACIKIMWLCNKSTEDRFSRFIADGLKNELKLKREIQKKIADREGKILTIEKRMLNSIEKYIASSNMSEDQIKDMLELPKLNQMIGQLKHDNLLYIVGQNIGSHHVHGTWSSLLLHYLEQDEDGVYSPRDHNCETHVNQYIWVSFLVLQAIKSFITFAIADVNIQIGLLDFVETFREGIDKLNQEAFCEDVKSINE